MVEKRIPRVNVEADKGNLRVRFTVSGARRVLSLGVKDTKVNRSIALAIAKQIEMDLLTQNFDHSLEKYKPTHKKKSTDSGSEGLSPQTIWERFTAYKKPTLKESTYHSNYLVVQKMLSECPVTDPLKAIELREWLLGHTTPGQARRVLRALSAAMEWGLKHGMVSVNKFEGMHKELPKPRYELESQANPFTPSEQKTVLEGFRTSFHYNHYYPFVKFLFLTGCRPSEAVGLDWGNVDLIKGLIYFREGITYTMGKSFHSDSTKNNENRSFPIYPQLRELLEDRPSRTGYVFPSPKGAFINYGNFSNKGWNTIVDPIKPNTTPYCCRDTFITFQAFVVGVPASLIAKWVGSSVETIEKHYLGNQYASNMLPGAITHNPQTPLRE
jgi:integrase